MPQRHNACLLSRSNVVTGREPKVSLEANAVLSTFWFPISALRVAVRLVSAPFLRPVKEELLRLLAQKNYYPANVPELLRFLRLPRNQQQVLQRDLRELEQTGRVARIKGNRYVIPRQADLIP